MTVPDPNPEAVEYAEDRLIEGADVEEVYEELEELGMDAALRSARVARQNVRKQKKERWS